MFYDSVWNKSRRINQIFMDICTNIVQTRHNKKEGFLVNVGCYTITRNRIMIGFVALRLLSVNYLITTTNQKVGGSNPSGHTKTAGNQGFQPLYFVDKTQFSRFLTKYI